MKRQWTVYLDAEGADAYQEDQVQRSVMDLTTCLLRLGGVGAISPVRRGVRDDEDGTVHYLNVGVHFVYDSYAPGINPDPEVVEDDVPVEPMEPVDPEPVVVGEPQD